MRYTAGHPPNSSIFVTQFNPKYGNTDLLILLRNHSSPDMVIFLAFGMWRHLSNHVVLVVRQANVDQF